MKDTSLDRSGLSSVGRRPLGERVYEALKVAIINGTLDPNTRLTESRVASKMGVSPTPVREAFRRLAVEGLVSIAPWSGVRVQSFSDQRIADTYQCREVLDGLACRLAAANIDAEGIHKLRQMLAASRRVRQASEVVDAFHDLIFTYARNSQLQGLVRLFREIIQRDRILTGYSATRSREILAEHAEIVAALEARDADRAERAGRLHIRNAFAYRLHARL